MMKEKISYANGKNDLKFEITIFKEKLKVRYPHINLLIE
jgi:hypothetical protein